MHFHPLIKAIVFPSVPLGELMNMHDFRRILRILRKWLDLVRFWTSQKRLFAIEIEPLHQSPQNFRFTKQKKLPTDGVKDLAIHIILQG